MRAIFFRIAMLDSIVITARNSQYIVINKKLTSVNVNFQKITFFWRRWGFAYLFTINWKQSWCNFLYIDVTWCYSRVMSPEVPAQNGLAAHQRTQSLDSMSSGHSSGSGSGSGTTPARRKNTVKPYEEVEMEQPLQPYR